jgi:hypothetical protein
MISYNIFDQEFLFSSTSINAPKCRYAWLEQDRGIWHLLTNLFADPAKSTRRWSNRQDAIEELENEGWTVLYPYPDTLPKKKGRKLACGYGLMWIDQ